MHDLLSAEYDGPGQVFVAHTVPVDGASEEGV